MSKKRQNEVKRNKFLVDEKKHNRTSHDVQFKEFSLTKQKLDLERTVSDLEKPFRKKIFKKSMSNCRM